MKKYYLFSLVVFYYNFLYEYVGFISYFQFD